MKIPADPKSRQFLQLNRYRRERQTVHVYLLSGTRFTGRIRSFDVHTLLLETQQGEMVIYSHAVSTIEQATAQRGRRPGAGSSDGASRYPDRMSPGPQDRSPGRRDDRFDDRPRRPEPAQWDPQAAGLSATDPDVELPAPGTIKPVAPTVTIVRRRSRLVPPRSSE